MRAPKKSETLEVRLPFETKSAFMARCQDEGRTASEAVRGFIEAELERGARRRPPRASPRTSSSSRTPSRWTSRGRSPS